MSPLLLLTALCLVIPALSARAAEEIAVVVAGKPLEDVPSYKIGSELYLDAKHVGAIYGGQVYWYPVSGRVQFSLRGRAIQFVADSDKAVAGEQVLALPAPARVRVGHALLPLSLLKSEAFALWSGFDARYDGASGTLEIEKRTTVGPVRAFSYRGRTRLALALAPGASYQSSARGVGAVEISLPYGVVEGDERVDLDDGIVSSYAVKQEPRQARLTIQFAGKGQRWRSTELSDPRRLVVDVYGPGMELASEVPAAQAPETRSPVAAASKPAKERRRVIVIDPGHGGKDPGATGAHGVKEKDVNLTVSLELARILRERGDMEIVLTREDDVFVPLSERSQKANGLEADLFISLHCNATRDRRENGFEVYSVSETASDPEAERLAAVENASLELEGKNPQDETAKLILLAMTRTEMLNESAPFAALIGRGISKRADVGDRGTKQAGFYVLRGTHAPSVLIEMAYLSNSHDAAKLGSRRFRRKFAEGVAAGVADYAHKKGWLQ